MTAQTGCVCYWVRIACSSMTGRTVLGVMGERRCSSHRGKACLMGMTAGTDISKVCCTCATVVVVRCRCMTGLTDLRSTAVCKVTARCICRKRCKACLHVAQVRTLAPHHVVTVRTVQISRCVVCLHQRCRHSIVTAKTLRVIQGCSSHIRARICLLYTSPSPRD